jgi:hypothetical protein
MNIDAKAREIAFSGHTTDEAYADLIRAALLAARNEALEKAAKVARDYAANRSEGWPGLDQDEVCHAVSAGIEEAIRALKGE